jgi:serine O-acetyltransferase
MTLSGIKLDYTVKVGRRVCIEHFGGMILGAHSIGNDVVIRQNTTFGVRRREPPFLKPVIEDGCELGPGVVIVGPVTIGRNSVIGANSVISRDVPPASFVRSASVQISPLRDPLAGTSDN